MNNCGENSTGRCCFCDSIRCGGGDLSTRPQAALVEMTLWGMLVGKMTHRAGCVQGMQETVNDNDCSGCRLVVKLHQNESGRKMKDECDKGYPLYRCERS